MPERATWASKAGFVLASAGAAVGLGAIWKFPWLAGSNGGAVFVIPYRLEIPRPTFILFLHRRESLPFQPCLHPGD